MRTTRSRLHGAQGLCLPRKRTRPRGITGLRLISISHLRIAGCCTSPAIAFCMHCHNYKPVSAGSRILHNSMVLARERSQACAIHNDGSELHGSYALTCVRLGQVRVGFEKIIKVFASSYLPHITMQLCYRCFSQSILQSTADRRLSSASALTLSSLCPSWT